MKKLRLLLAFCALLLGWSNAMAQETPSDGSAYYIYNADNDLFFTRGGEWGTQAYASPLGIPWRVEITGGNYTLKMYDIYTQNSNDTGLGFNGSFTDNGSPIALTPSGDASNGFTLKNGDNYVTCPATKGVVTMTAIASNWKFLTQAQYEAVLASRASTQEAAVAASKGIVIPGGNTLADVVSDVNAWTALTTKDATPTKASWPISGNANRQGAYNEGGYGIEMFQTNNASITRTITGLAKGIYKVSVRGMKRMGTNEGSVAMKTAGFYVSDAYMVANGNIIPVKSWAADNTANDVPNGPDAVVTIINNNGYTTEGFVYVGDDGNLELTFSNESFWWGGWTVFNGVSYTFYNNEVSDEDAEAILNQANALADADMQGSIKTALTNAKNTFDAARTIANYNDLSTAITNASESKSAYAKAKAYLDETPTILASTNFYTAAAYATYYSEPKAKYDAKTLTNVEANAFTTISNGWQSNNTVRNILLSAWKIGGEQCKDFDKALYINTWSGEGAGDGSGFLVPFYEYFVDATHNLPTATMTATLTDLENGVYEVELWARVQRRSDADFNANNSMITMNVNGGDAVSIMSDTEHNVGTGGSEMRLGHYTATGIVTDGTLTLSIDVKDGSNVHWLSWRDVTYTKVLPASITSTTGVATLYTPYALNFSKVDGLKAYTATVSGDEVVVTEVDNVPANTGVILKGAVGNYNIPVIAASNEDQGELTGNATEATAFDAFAGYDIYVLAINGSGDAQFQKTNEGSVAAGKAFLKIAQDSNVKVFNIVDGTATGVEAPEVAEAEEEEEILYNTAGVRVGKDYKGIVINQKGEKRLQK